MKLCPGRCHTRAVLEAWHIDYNNKRIHSRLGWISPATYAATSGPLRFASLSCAIASSAGGFALPAVRLAHTGFGQARKA
jgi:putative transposase